MSEHGYIYVRNWERFQHYHDRRPSWIKLYVDLLGDDDWLDLSPSDWKLLTVIWMLTANLGWGRVRADQGWLKAQAKTPKGSLQRLNDAGFIEFRASTPASGSVPQRQRQSKETDKEPLEISRNRSSRAQGTATKDERPTLTGEAARIIDQAIAAKLTAAQVKLIQDAWEVSPDLRHSMADVERAENPVAMLVSVAKRILPADTMSPTERIAHENSQKAARIARCRRNYNEYIESGETPERAREFIAQDYYQNPELVTEAIGAA